MISKLRQLNRFNDNFVYFVISLKEYVRTNIPEIKPNKAIRDYLLRLEFWAPWTLKEEYAQKCEYR